jgi:hypothetical protein
MSQSASSVVFGEGERTVMELTDRVKGRASLESVYGVAFTDDSGITVNRSRELIEDLDTLPFPAWNLIPMHRHTASTWFPNKAEQYTIILTSRGCLHGCIACGAKTTWTEQCRVQGAEPGERGRRNPDRLRAASASGFLHFGRSVHAAAQARDGHRRALASAGAEGDLDMPVVRRHGRRRDAGPHTAGRLLSDLLRAGVGLHKIARPAEQGHERRSGYRGRRAGQDRGNQGPWLPDDRIAR